MKASMLLLKNENPYGKESKDGQLSPFPPQGTGRRFQVQIKNAFTLLNLCSKGPFVLFLCES